MLTTSMTRAAETGSASRLRLTALTAVLVSLTVTVAAAVPTPSAQPRLSVNPEVYMDPTQLITSKGFPCENHYVTTQDGFILNLQRIPHGRQDNTPRAPRPVVILQHGLHGSSSNWLDNPATESLAYLLADQGADVWLGNSRGNTFSRNHTTLNHTQPQFWDWSYDEIAALDLPAMFDHVVSVTGAPRVHYVGHSQGTMVGFAAFSANRTLAAMVKRFYALAPVANVWNIKSPIAKLAPFAHDLVKFLELFGHGAFDENNRKLRDFLARDVCQRLGALLCEDDLFVIGGQDKGALNTSRIDVYIAHTPAGTSVKNIQHFAQGVTSKKFQMFDYGSAKANIAKYGQPTPPQYSPEQIAVPVVTYSGGRDILADPTDVAWLLARLPPSLLLAHTFIPAWEHLDFIWAFDAPRVCYNDISKWIFQD